MKKIALISDIQGNYTALTHVLQAIDADGIDDIICLGDVASGAQPHQTVTLLRQRNIRALKGNMDDALLNPQRHETEDLDVQRYDDIDFWCSNQLTVDDKTFMRGFAPLLTIPLDEMHNLLCFHGSPYSYNDVIDENVTPDEVTQRIDGYDETVMATGHIHHQMLRMHQDSIILCPGSVGLPRQQDGKHPLYAEYAVIAHNAGKIHIDFRQITIPTDKLKKGILNSGMPHANWFLSLWDI